MFARLRRGFGHRPMQVIGHAQIYDLEVGSLDYARVVHVGIGDAVPSAVRLNTLLGTADRRD